MKFHLMLTTSIVLILAVGSACTASPAVGNVSTEPASTPVILPTLTATEATQAELIPVTDNLMRPAENVPAPIKIADDVISSGASAPYGDSYKLNRFERPFLQDMTYVADMDISKFSLSQDQDWYYASIRMAGSDPNNALGIDFGVEIDLDADGFGDYMIWTHPPYTTEWSTGTVQVYQDSNHDTGGVSALQSDSAQDGNGYETLVFDGSTGENKDPDLAWVRLNPDFPGLIQIAFKKSVIGPAFLMGVVSDAGLKDMSKYDYADHIPETDAGSPVKGNKHFPLGSLYTVDNTCWDAFGISTTGYEPKLCPPILQPVSTKDKSDNGSESANACNPTPNCGGGPYDPNTCQCQ